MNTNTIHVSNVNALQEDTQVHRCQLLSSKRVVLTGQEKQQQQQSSEDYNRFKKKCRGNRKEQHERRRQRRRQQKLNNTISDNTDHIKGPLNITTESSDNGLDNIEYLQV